MLSTFLSFVKTIFKIFGIVLVPLGVVAVIFTIDCIVWVLIFKHKHGKYAPLRFTLPPKRENILKTLFVSVPRRFVLDKIDREADYFAPRGIHMFCGEQGSGKTIAAAEMIMRLQNHYPKAKTITNFAYARETDALETWQQLLTYNNGHQGVIVGIDEIQNWFMSGLNKLPEGMLEVVTQNRKNNRILCCTAQVFTRVNKGIREQVSMVYNPHTFLGCFTIVIKRKPEFDSEGNVTKMKYRGMYCFCHSDALRKSYDTYKVIHTLSKEGFKEIQPIYVTNAQPIVTGK